jgi:hypothetical protein
MKVTIKGPASTETITGVTDVRVEGPVIVLSRPGMTIFHYNGQFRYTYTVEYLEDEEDTDALPQQ